MKLKEPLSGIKMLQGHILHHIACVIVMTCFVSHKKPDDTSEVKWKGE